MGVLLPEAGLTQAPCPSISFMFTTETLSLSTVWGSFDRAGLAQLADLLELTSQVAFAM